MSPTSRPARGVVAREAEAGSLGWPGGRHPERSRPRRRPCCAGDRGQRRPPPQARRRPRRARGRPGAAPGGRRARVPRPDRRRCDTWRWSGTTPSPTWAATSPGPWPCSTTAGSGVVLTSIHGRQRRPVLRQAGRGLGLGAAALTRGGVGRQPRSRLDRLRLVSDPRSAGHHPQRRHAGLDHDRGQGRTALPRLELLLGVPAHATRGVVVLHRGQHVVGEPGGRARSARSRWRRRR